MTTVCERCGCTTDKLYSETQENSCGDVITMQVCWDCDHDIINGGDLFEDAANIYSDRRDEAYAYDPINNPRPY